LTTSLDLRLLDRKVGDVEAVYDLLDRGGRREAAAVDVHAVAMRADLPDSRPFQTAGSAPGVSLDVETRPR